MKQFVKFFVACTLSIFLLILIVAVVLFIYVKSSNASPAFNKEEILVLHFQNEIKENVKVGKFDRLLNKDRELSLFEITESIKQATKDERIKGILINGKSNISLNQAYTILQALTTFKKSGKFIESYGEYYSQSTYALSTIADRITLNPNGHIYYKGFGFVNFYLKDFLKKYHVKPNFFVAGKYKSFIEMFSRNGNSPENNTQYNEVLEGLNKNLDSIISYNRKIPMKKVRDIRENFIGNNIHQSLQVGLIDTSMYKSDYLKTLTDRLDINKDEAFISIEKYHSIINSEKKLVTQKPEIAIVFAEGEITSQKGDDAIDEARYRKVFNSIRENKNIKAIVLRINSPGGRSTTSDELWHEVELCRKDSLPVYVSMSNYAASGGYYIATAANKIYAEPTTVTGSIGVFSMIFEFKDALDKNFDIHVDYIRTSPYSLGTNALVNMTSEQKVMMQNNTDLLYQTFKERVSRGRNIPLQKVEELAQGRVYLGEKAKKNGLIDEIGTLSDVLKEVRNTHSISIEGYEIYPKNSADLQEEIVEIFTNKNPFSSKVKKVLGKSMAKFLEIENQNGTFMRMPYFEIE